MYEWDIERVCEWERDSLCEWEREYVGGSEREGKFVSGKERDSGVERECGRERLGMG